MKTYTLPMAAAILLVSAAYADVDTTDLPIAPQPLRVSSVRALLESTFPIFVFGNGTKTRDTIVNFGVDLERFRSNYLEGFARQIRQSCNNAKLFEEHINQRARDNDISRTDYENGVALVRLERLNCDTRNYHASKYWILYDEYLEKYRDAVRLQKQRLGQCMSQDSCRRREN